MVKIFTSFFKSKCDIYKGFVCFDQWIKPQKYSVFSDIKQGSFLFDPRNTRQKNLIHLELPLEAWRIHVALTENGRIFLLHLFFGGLCVFAFAACLLFKDLFWLSAALFIHLQQVSAVVFVLVNLLYFLTGIISETAGRFSK